MSDIDATVEAGLTAWAGSGAVMTLMLGDQDVSRFSSVSAGDDGGDTWTPAPQSTDPVVYAKQALALGLVFTLPGAQATGASKPAMETPVTVTSDGPRFTARMESLTGCPAITRPSSATASKERPCAASTASS